MDEKNAYIELVKQNRAKHRAKLKASKEIKKLEQKKEKVILKYEQAAKDNTCITFHQYCRKKWASEAGIESVPDDDETDVEWQEKLNAKQKEEDAWEDVPDVGNGLKRVNERLVARLRVILGTELVDHDLKLGAKTNITAQNAAFFDLLLLFEKKEGVQLFKNFMARALDEAAREDGWWLDSLDDSVMKAGDEVLKEIIIRGMNNARVNGNLDKSQMYFFENMIKLYQNFLPDEMSNISKENDLYTQYKKDEKAYRTQFNNFFRGFVDPTYEIPEVSCGWITIHNKMGTVYSSTINEYAAKIQNYANGTSNHESWYGSIYVDANGGYREYVVVETDGTLSFPEQGDYDLIYLNTGKTAGVQDSKGFEKDVPLYYLLGDYDSDYDKYTDLEGAAEAMKEYPHEVYLMTIDTGYAA